MTKPTKWRKPMTVSSPKLSSTTPFFIRAFYQWINDNHMTPYLSVNATAEGVRVPMELTRNGFITLNLRMDAVDRLMMENTHISFSARFNKVSRDIYIPIEAVVAIFAKEDPEQMLTFAMIEAPPPAVEAPAEETPPTEPTPPKRPSLSIVK